MNKKKGVIYIIRHGKTLANENKLYCGSSNISLSLDGMRELLDKKKILMKIHDPIYITSGFKRADQTLLTLFNAEKNIEISELAEFNFGDFEMKSYEELKHNLDYQLWIGDESGNQYCPNGESRNNFEKRVVMGFRRVLKALEDSEKNRAVVICHGGTIATIMKLLFPKENKHFYDWQPKCGSGYGIWFDLKSGDYHQEEI